MASLCAVPPSLYALWSQVTAYKASSVIGQEMASGVNGVVTHVSMKSPGSDPV